VAEQRALDLVLAHAVRDEFDTTWDRLLRAGASAVDLLERKQVAAALRMSEKTLGNVLHERDKHRLRGKHLVWIGRQYRPFGEQIATEGLGLIVQPEASPPSELEELEAAIVAEHGPAGAATVARVRRIRELRRAVERFR
jgi:hypothetical protein